MRAAFIIILLLISLNAVNAQGTSFGFEAGQNMSTTKLGALKIQSVTQYSFHVGFTASQHLFDRISLQTGITYMRQDNSEGVKTQSDFTTYTSTYFISSMDNLIIPFDLVYHAPRGISIGFGVFGAYNLTHGPVLVNPQCAMGPTKWHVPYYDDPMTYGLRYSIGADLMENQSIGLGFALRYYEQYSTLESKRTTSYANTASLSLFINYKGRGQQLIKTE